MHSVNLSAPASDENRTESESCRVPWADEIAPVRLGFALRAIRDRAVERDNAAGGILTLGSWQTREATALNEKSGTFDHWINGEAFPEWPRFDKLVARYKTPFLLDVYPGHGGQSEITPDQALDVMRRFVETHRDGGGGS